LDFVIAPLVHGHAVTGPFQQLPFLFDNGVLASMLLIRVVHKENLHVLNLAALRELDRCPLVDRLRQAAEKLWLWGGAALQRSVPGPLFSLPALAHELAA